MRNIPFGLVSVAFGGNTQGIGAGMNLEHQSVSTAQAHAFEYTFLIRLIPVVAGGLVLLAGRSSYPVDVASAAESDRRSRQFERPADP